jgi:hypothetical protein
MGKINRAWHLANKMPKNASIEEKIIWHTGHARNCSCRESKEHLIKLKAILKK